MASSVGERLDLTSVAALRQEAYRFLALLLCYPSEERRAPVRDIARYLRHRSAASSRFAFHITWDGLLRRIESGGPGTEQDLQASYSRLFIGNAAQKAIPLSECGYTNPMTSGLVLAEVEGGYGAVGLRLGPGGAAPDHVTTELEFISFLCGKESEAWRSGDKGQALDLLSRQKTFLEAHLFRWLPLLENAVTRRERDGFYAEVIRASWALIAHDVDMMGFLISRLREAVKVH